MPQKPYRRKKARVSILGTTQLHLRCPWVIALWSAIFPGMGHLLLSKYITGFILFIWEVLINLESRLNLAIFYSFTGKFEAAKATLDIRWVMLYIPTYLFAIWDSYRTAVDMNNHYILAAREDAEVKPFVIHPLGLNYLDKNPPWVAAAWSMFSPGVGQLVIHRIMVAFFLIPWWIAVAYFSKILPALHYSLLRKFELAKTAADIQWILNIPSIFFFGIYDAYTNAAESNKLYDWELGKFLRREHQPRDFIVPAGSGNAGGTGMHVVANFDYSIHIEAAVTALEMKGVTRENILAVPLDKRNTERRLFDDIHYSTT
jgi:hypothetical protein